MISATLQRFAVGRCSRSEPGPCKLGKYVSLDSESAQTTWSCTSGGISVYLLGIPYIRLRQHRSTAAAATTTESPLRVSRPLRYSIFISEPNSTPMDQDRFNVAVIAGPLLSALYFRCRITSVSIARLTVVHRMRCWALLVSGGSIAARTSRAPQPIYQMKAISLDESS